jgi:hypothetical protein
MTKICAVTLMLISSSVSTLFAEQRPGNAPRQVPRTRTEDSTAELLAALIEKLDRLEKRQGELSEKLDNVQHRLDGLATKP